MIDPRLSQMPLTMLQQAVLGQVPGVHPYAALSRINQMVTDNQAKAAQQGQAAMGANAQQQQQPPVAQQVMQASMQPIDQGIGSIPTRQNYANGGIVAFADDTDKPDGSMVSDDFFSEQVNTGGASPIPYHTPKPSAERDRLNSIPADVLRYITEAITGPKFLGDPRLSYNMQSAKEATVKGKEDTRQQAAQEAFRRGELPQNNTASPPAGIASLAPAKQAPAQQGGIPRPQVSTPAAAPPAVAPEDEIDKLFKSNTTNLSRNIGTDYSTNSKPTPEVLAAQQAVNSQHGEDTVFRKAIADKMAGRAKLLEDELNANKTKSLFDNPEFLGALASGAKGKTFGDVLSGAAGAGGKELSRQGAVTREDRQFLMRTQDLADQARIAQLDYQAAGKGLILAQATNNQALIMAATKERDAALGRLNTVTQAYKQHREASAALVQQHAATNASNERIAAGTQAAMRYRADAETGKLSDKAEKDDTMAVQKQISNVMTLAKSGGLANAIGYAAANEQGKNKIIQDAVMGNLTPSQQAIFGRMVLTSAQPGAGATPSGWVVTRN